MRRRRGDFRRPAPRVLSGRGAVMALLFTGVGWTDVALTLSRVAVGAFFMLSGYHKLFNADRHRSIVDELKALGIHAIGFNQWWVPSVEFAAGAAVVVGLWRRSPRWACWSSSPSRWPLQGRQRIKLHKPIDQADRIDDWLYLPETLYAFMLILVVSAAPGLTASMR